MKTALNGRQEHGAGTDTTESVRGHDGVPPGKESLGQSAAIPVLTEADLPSEDPRHRRGEALARWLLAQWEREQADASSRN
jgi:hypothetical protein